MPKKPLKKSISGKFLFLFEIKLNKYSIYLQLFIVLKDMINNYKKKYMIFNKIGYKNVEQSVLDINK